MAFAIDIIDGHGLSNKVHIHKYLPKETKVKLYYVVHKRRHVNFTYVHTYIYSFSYRSEISYICSYVL